MIINKQGGIATKKNIHDRIFNRRNWFWRKTTKNKERGKHLTAQFYFDIANIVRVLNNTDKCANVYSKH